MQDSRESHWKDSKIIIRYIKGTYQFGITYCRRTELSVGYTDFNYGGDIDDKKSTSHYVFQLISRPLVWLCEKQKVVSVSTTKDEYHGTANVGTKAVWIHHLLEELGFPIQASTLIYYDNHSTLQVADNLVSHRKMKHVEIHVHYLR